MYKVGVEFSAFFLLAWCPDLKRRERPRVGGKGLVEDKVRPVKVFGWRIQG